MRPILTSRQYWWFAFGFLGLAVYGSLVPFHFHPLPLSEAVERFLAALHEPVRVTFRSDWAANILLFIPLSFLLMAALAVDRPRKVGWRAAVGVLPACTLLSAAIEFTQLYFPPRVTSVDDVVAESIGGLMGIGLWLSAGQWITLRFRRFWIDLGGGQGSTGLLLQVYMAFLVVVHVMPMDLTISPAELYRKYREGRVVLVPFDTGSKVDFFARIQKCFTNVAFFLPVGILLAGLVQPFWRRGRNWPAIFGLGIIVAGIIEIMQLFVVTRFFDSTDIFTGGLGVLAGWGLGLIHFQEKRASLPGGIRRAEQVASKASGKGLAFGAFGVWLAVLVFFDWQPFSFELSVSEAARRLGDVSMVPFADYQQSDYLSAFDQICSKPVLFMPVGALLAFLGFGHNLRDYGLVVLPPAIALTTLLEAGQLFLPTRYASVTDIIIETFGVWAGFILARRSQTRSSRT